jgi:hypothetical protein
LGAIREQDRTEGVNRCNRQVRGPIQLSPASSRSIAATERSTSFLWSTSSRPRFRMYRRPRRVVPPIQALPSRCTASISRSVLSSEPKLTRTWLRTIRSRSRRHPARPAVGRSGGPGRSIARRAGPAHPAPALGGPPRSRSRGPGGRTLGRNRRGRGPDLILEEPARPGPGRERRPRPPRRRPRTS